MEACDATAALRAKTSVDAVEIFDRRSLRLAAERGEMVSLAPVITQLAEDGEAAALLIECRGDTEDSLAAAIDEVCGALKDSAVPILSTVSASRSSGAPGSPVHFLLRSQCEGQPCSVAQARPLRLSLLPRRTS